MIHTFFFLDECFIDEFHDNFHQIFDVFADYFPTLKSNSFVKMENQTFDP